MRQVNRMFGLIAVVALLGLTTVSASTNWVIAAETNQSSAITASETSDLTQASPSGMAIANAASDNSETTETTNAEHTSQSSATTSSSATSDSAATDSADSSSSSTKKTLAKAAALSTGTIVAGQTSGQLGTVTWTITNKVLHLSGGNFGSSLYEYQHKDSPTSPWNAVMTSFTSISIDGPITANAGADYSYLFASLTSAASINGLSQMDFSQVTSAYLMFWGDKVTTLDLGNADFSSMTDMNAMFSGCFALTTLDVSKWNLSHVTTIGSLFFSCSALTNLDVSHWDVSSVTDFKSTFSYCKAITSLDLSNWDMRKSTTQGSLFAGMSQLDRLTLGTNTKINASNLPTPPTNTTYNGKWVKTGSSTMYTPADLMAKYDGSSAMTGTYVWASDAMVITKYVDEDGTELATADVQNGAAGSAYTTSAPDITGYTLKTKPANATGTFTNSVITVTYVYAGKLFFQSVPTAFDFGNHLISSATETYALTSTTGDLKVQNNGKLNSGWTLSAKLATDFTGADTGAKLGATLYYQTSDGTKIPITTASDTALISNTTTNHDPVDVTGNWSSDAEGLKLKVAGGTARQDSYHATVDWNLSNTVANN
ncbi:BspA family leucine-rich repeat surface protein [Lactiplantibacillus dongliensis]|uniref:BspA family leucine-rich repeat surface protein n=1 Tax=Lactiplantibacillus dongliensis TaxID=2559919 RepID=A0ABW1R4P8_9LACO|nr:BspA family leucine-rich repeat surface protein [Lactiplantibacillus dongliensis]